MTTLLGVDCSTNPAKTGLAVGHLRGEAVCIDQSTTGASWRSPASIVLEWLDGHDDVLLALDSPLGWPQKLGPSLATHKAGEPLEVDPNVLFRRAADREIKRRLGKQPLDVGADRIARTAVAALKFLQTLRSETGRTIPMAWGPGEPAGWRVIEVYPAATRLAHGVLDKGGVLDGFGQVLDCSVVDAETCSIDEADACVCVLAAADFLLGRAIPPADLNTARTEGWIWAPDPAKGEP
jgi:hypothetical protein